MLARPGPILRVAAAPYQILIAVFAISYFACAASWGTITFMAWSRGAGNVQSAKGVDVGFKVRRGLRRGVTGWLSPIAGICLVAAAPASASAEDLSVSEAWVPASESGADVGLYMTIKNDGADADALLRVSCPFANFTERRTVDVGEGGLSDRAVPNIPIGAHSTLTMTAKSFHVALLQTREKLTAGQSLSCRVSFRKAGPMDVKVTVLQSAPKP
jgi:copper(I)-binding protein